MKAFRAIFPDKFWMAGTALTAAAACCFYWSGARDQRTLHVWDDATTVKEPSKDQLS